MRAAPHPIDTWSSCIALVGSESTLAGAASRRFSATSAACVYPAIISPESTPGLAARNGGSPWERAGVEQPVGPPLGDRADLGGRDREEVARHPHRRPVEVAARLDAPVGQDHRVVDRGPQLHRRHPRSERQRVARRPEHLGRAPQRVRVLDARIAVRDGWRRSQTRRAAPAGWPRSPPARAAAATRSGPRRTPGRSRAAPRPTSPPPRRRPAAAASRSTHASTSIPSIPSVPLISASPSLAVSSIGSIPAAASASAAGNDPPEPSSTEPSPISTSAQCASGARSPLAPSDPYSGTTGVSPAPSSERIRSATTGRAPEHPIASVRARSSIIARTTSRSTGGPIPAACERTSARWSATRASAGIRTSASDPNPVVIPYAGSSDAARATTTAALRSIAARASAPKIDRRVACARPQPLPQRTPRRRPSDTTAGSRALHPRPVPGPHLERALGRLRAAAAAARARAHRSRRRRSAPPARRRASTAPPPPRPPAWTPRSSRAGSRARRRAGGRARPCRPAKPPPPRRRPARSR